MKGLVSANSLLNYLCEIRNEMTTLTYRAALSLLSQILPKVVMKKLFLPLSLPIVSPYLICIVSIIKIILFYSIDVVISCHIVNTERPSSILIKIMYTLFTKYSFSSPHNTTSSTIPRSITYLSPPAIPPRTEETPPPPPLLTSASLQDIMATAASHRRTKGKH